MYINSYSLKQIIMIYIFTYYDDIFCVTKKKRKKLSINKPINKWINKKKIIQDDLIKTLYLSALCSEPTHLIPQSICHIEGLEEGHHEQVVGEGSCVLVSLE